MRVDVPKFFEQAESLIDLEQRLRDSNWVIRDLDDFMNLLDSHAEYVNKKTATSFPMVPDHSDLYTVRCEVQEKSYQLHGLWAGSKLPLLFNWKPSDILKSHVKETIERWLNTPVPEHCYHQVNAFRELDMSGSVGLPENDEEPVTSLRELIRRKNGEGHLKSIVDSAWVQMHIAGLNLVSWLIFRPFKSLDYKEKGLYLSRKAVQYPQYQNLLAGLITRTELQQPLNLEYRFLENSRDVERSFLTANELRDNAARCRGNTIHYIGEPDTITEIAYFLKNPDYSLDPIRRFRDNYPVLNKQTCQESPVLENPATV